MLFFIAVEDDIQKQPFANVLQNSCSQKNFTRKHLRWNNKVIKKRLQLRFFPMNIAKFLRTAFFRSSHQRCSFRKVVLRNFAKFTGKHLCQSFFFNKVAGLLEKKLWHRCLPLNFAKFLRTSLSQNTSGRLLPFFIEHIQWLFLDI